MTEPIASVPSKHPGAQVARQRWEAYRAGGGPGPADREPDQRYVDPASLITPDGPGPPPSVPRRYHVGLDELEQTEYVRLACTWLHDVTADPDADHRGLLLLGPVGPGKSTIAGALALALGAPRRAKFWPVDALLKAIKDEYGTTNDARRRVLDAIDLCPVLVLDDLGVEKPSTEWSRGIIGALISSAYDSGKLLIITSNKSPQELADHLGDPRLTSRLTQMLDVVEVDGPDRRRR